MFIKILLAIVLALLGCCSDAFAGFMLPNLLPGTKYRLAFVTSTTRDAKSSNIADYNSFVTTAANSVPELAALGTTWMAIGSTATVDARDNTQTNPNSDGAGVPLFLVDGTLLALGNVDFWDGTIDHSLNVLPSGISLTEDPFGNAFLAHTGTLSNGTKALGLDLPGSLGSPGDFEKVFGGNPFSTNHNWIEGAGSRQGLNLPFYAISGTLTAVHAVPEPSSVVMLATGALGLLFASGKRHQSKLAA